jgi:uncharacterized protein YndB with AHSA1/START domain
MYEIHVEVEIAAPIGRVFDALSDHETFFRGSFIQRCAVTRPGKDEKNGYGAVREIDARGQHFVEEVVRFDRPRRFDYIVRSVTRGGRRVPLEHEIGWLELTESGDKTRVVWRSRFRIAIPVVGFLVERVQGPKGAAAFERLLIQAQTDLEAGSGSDEAAA